VSACDMWYQHQHQHQHQHQRKHQRKRKHSQPLPPPAPGMVRVWRISKSSQVMEASMKDHKGPVNSIAIKSTADDECVSASSDGSAIIWDLATGKRRASLFANTFFQGVAYYPDDSQLVTVGSDRKVSVGAAAVRGGLLAVPEESGGVSSASGPVVAACALCCAVQHKQARNGDCCRCCC
jgi:hypothetical protein